MVHVWKGREGTWKAEMTKITEKNLSVLLSSPWYLNHISTGPDWKTIYLCEPLCFNGERTNFIENFTIKSFIFCGGMVVYQTCLLSIKVCLTFCSPSVVCKYGCFPISVSLDYLPNCLKCQSLYICSFLFKTR